MSTGKGLFTLLCGAAIGAVAALLLTPKTGAETRAQIMDILHEKGIDINQDDVEKLVNRILEKIKGATDPQHIRQMVEEELA